MRFRLDLSRPSVVLTILLGICLSYFLSLPLSGELPGNVDTLLGIALSDLTREIVGLFFFGSSTSTVFFPEASFLPYGENCFGLIASFLFCKALAFGSDIWGYYLLTSILTALSAFGVFKLATLFVRSRALALLSGLAFALAGFTLGNVDDLNVIFVFFPAMSLYFLERAVREKNTRHLAAGFALAGLQVWFGFYVFLFQTFAVSIFLVFNARSLARFVKLKAAVSATAAYLLAALPLVALYFYYHLEFRPSSVYQTYNDQIRHLTSLKLHHFWNVLENGRIHSTLGNVYDASDTSMTSRLRKSCFPGFVFSIFFLVGIFRSARKSTWLTATFVAFSLLSFGTNSPLFSLLEELPLGDYLRIPLRFYLFSLLAAVVFFAIGTEFALDEIRTRFGPRSYALSLGAIGVFVLLETTPFPLKGYPLASALAPPEGYVQHFEGRPTRAVVLDLPSNLRQVFRANADADTITTFSREILYMIWQTRHRQIILGGVSGYQPDSRNELDRIASRLPGHDALVEIRAKGATHLVFHKNSVMLPGEDILFGLEASDLLRKEFENERIAIFAY